MYAELPADARQSHPFHMLDEIRAQPEAVARSIALVESRAGEVVESLRRAERAVFTGCGTSFHAAQAGAWIWKELTGSPAEAIEAWDLASYGDVRRGDIVLGVTHSAS